MNSLWRAKTIWNIDFQEHQMRFALCEVGSREPQILQFENLKIESFYQEKWGDFFEKLRIMDQKKSHAIALCLPERNLIIRPLPAYPHLSKKELKQALSVFQEQILPWTSKNHLSAVCILPPDEIQRKKENRCSGLIYVIECDPYQDFFKTAQEFGYTIEKVCLRAVVYNSIQMKSQAEGLLFMLEFFQKSMRCHLFQNDILTNYRDFELCPTHSELLVFEPLEKAIRSYIRYFIDSLSEAKSIQLQICISEEAEDLNKLVDSITKEITGNFPEAVFLPELTFRQTSEILALLSTQKERRMT